MDKNTKKLKEEKLKSRLMRDFLFITLGIIFLIVSIIIAVCNNNQETNNKKVITIQKEN
ncbi:MAG: hypothetical protein RSA10_03570 [Bacilli bacterium]